MGFFGALTEITGYASVGLGLSTLAALDPVTYRPGPWSNPFWSPGVMVTVPGSAPQSTNTSISDITGDGSGPYTLSIGRSESIATTPAQTYVWDGYPRVEHEFQSVATKFPLQTGARGTDGAFNLPRRLTVEIVSSDAQQSYIPGQFSQGPVSGSDPYLFFTESKSVNAYQTLRRLWQANTLVTVTTRLDTYENMLIVGGRSIDDDTTRNGMRCVVVFEEIISGVISQTNVSARDDANGTTAFGEQQVSTPDTAAEASHTVTPDPFQSIDGTDPFSSNPIGS